MSVQNHGFILDILKWGKLIFGEPNNWTIMQLILISNIFILASFCIEKYGFAKLNFSKNHLGISLIISNLLMTFITLVSILLLNENHLLGAIFSGLYYFTIILKLISYHMFGYWCRENLKKLASKTDENTTNNNENIAEEMSIYPKNLTLKNIYYFIMAPTLCYQINYPRNERISIGFLIKRFIEFVSEIYINLYYFN